VAQRPHWILLSAAAAALALAGGGSSATSPSCAPSQLAGSFVVIPGSAGAGNISYRLNVRQLAGPACFVSRLPRIQLLSRLRRPLPTKVVPAFRQGLLAPRVVLRPGYGAKAEARFSPDVPGVGEPVAGRNCERTAYFMRVALPPGGATFLARIKPATPVCEHGTMSFSALGPTRT
jgi:hypothetical protein